MHRRTRQSKSSRKNVDSSSSDSSSDSDSDNSLEQQTASDVINSFLHPSRTVQHVNTAKSRKASDVINSFLQKNKIVDRASPSQYNSALDVINSYLRKDNFGDSRTSTGASGQRRKEFSDSSTSESDSEFVTNKRRRRAAESSTSGSESDLETNGNPAKRRRIGDTTAVATINNEPINSPTSGNNASNGGSLEIQVAAGKNPELSNGNHPLVSTVNQQSTSDSPATRRTLRSNSSKEDADKIKSNVKRKQKAGILKMSFTREVFSRKTRVRRIIEQQTTIRNYRIPKDKYDNALDMLNATECRYDKTPVDYNAPRPWYDFRQSCSGRRRAEAAYDTDKLGTSVPISLTRIVFELDNCLKKENWSQMAELIYFGCGLMKTDQIRRAIGSAFFTYALLLLLLDPNPESISTLDGKRNEILKFLIALGSEPEESEEFLKDLHLVTNENDTTNGLMTIASEEK